VNPTGHFHTGLAKFGRTTVQTLFAALHFGIGQNFVPSQTKH